MAKAGKVGTKLSKGGLITAITETVGDGVSRKNVKAILETLTTVGYKELKKNGSFVVPGFAKYVVVKRPARPAREGINPFTKQPTTFAAKPASKVVRARPVKALKDAVK
jgi:nucleoid DNA-binding protein